MTLFLMVSLCGGLGSMARFVLNASIQRWWDRLFPLSTMLINILACFCVGLAASAYANQTVDQTVYLLFVTGFFGGFSTFSTAINELHGLLAGRHWGTALAYLLLTVLLPLACVALGWWLVALAN
jgi:CrcB protein